LLLGLTNVLEGCVSFQLSGGGVAQCVSVRHTDIGASAYCTAGPGSIPGYIVIHFLTGSRKEVGVGLDDCNLC
jgi:hypothetical protein